MEGLATPITTPWESRYTSELIVNDKPAEYLGLMYSFYHKVDNQISPLEVLGRLIKGTVVLFGTRKDRRPVAYVVAEAHEDELHILQTYSEDRKATKILAKYVDRKAFEGGYDRLIMFTDRSPRAWERAYGFKLAQYKMVKELTYGQQSGN